jgi:LmbE family N-acetylglucosaminyl deacetylase
MNVFLLAHQDDEIGIFETLYRCVRRGEFYQIYYLTNGAWNAANPETRNRESLAVLSRIGVATENVHFLGEELDISDSTLPDRIEDAFQALVKRLDAMTCLQRIVCHAWEGGHQDHDAAHVVGVLLAKRYDVMKSSRQFGLYRAADNPFLPYVVWRPLMKNGPVETIKIPPLRRLFYLKLMLLYRSQYKAMAYLLPFVAAHYLSNGAEQLQPLTDARLNERPQQGALLYEKRGRYRFEALQRKVRSLS